MPPLPASFHPLIRSWFIENYGKPTAVQAEAWPLIEKGEHVLALAPTGSGKTLTAFLSAVSRFCGDCGGAAPRYPADKLTVLYVSPLKALNEDIKRNLLEPLAAIRSRFDAAALPFPALRVETRSGDTPQPERRRLLVHPPSILALTPESLAILLLNPRGRQILSTVKYLILDEIHAVLGNKRGAFLSCQIDRLALIAGEFQRVSLSATVRLPEAAAEFTGGMDRRVHIVAPLSEKKIDFRVEYPEPVRPAENDKFNLPERYSPPDGANDAERIDKYGKRYAGLINYVLNRIGAGSTILVFTDSRRRAERFCYFLNQEGAGIAARNGGFGGPVAFAHHGSLSKEIRRAVEKRLAEGSLSCVVATASLELGIDIGGVDEVVLAGSPGSVSQALQRIGRSGHGVGKVSRGSLFPFHGMDLLLAAALKGAVEDRDIEEICPVENPLDILAQLILALCVERKWNVDELYAALRRFYVFRNLDKDTYIRTARMLAGLGEKGRLREIKPRIWFDRISGEIGALEGALPLLYMAGGVITNRGLYSLRLAGGAKIGELDEEFVWERRIGDRFDFGGRGWRIVSIGAESVEVTPLDTSAGFVPFWKADAVFRSPNLSVRILAILDRYNAAGRVSEDLSEPAPAALNAFLDSQRNAQKGLPLTDNGTVTVEIIDSPESGGDFYSVVIHTFRGGAVNYPLSLALAGELEEAVRLRVETFSGDDAILFLVPRLGITESGAASIEEVFRRALISLESGGGGGISRGERLFRNRLESSGIFGANFREAAGRSLLLPKNVFGKRAPLWITRQRSRRLFDAVISEEGFPVTAEAWRSCLKDIFDMEGFRGLLGDINNGNIRLSFFRCQSPSPFSRGIVRQETNDLLYEYDERKDIPGRSGLREASLSDKVIREALGDAGLRPRLKRELTAGFVSRLRGELPGWAPEDELSLCELVKERIAVPLDEWETLCAALPEPLVREAGGGADSEGRIKIIRRKGAALASVVHREWEETWKTEPLTLLGLWLRREGPVSLLRITEVFGAAAAETEDALDALVEIGEIVRDVALEPDTAGGFLICDRENLDMLLRLSRKKAQPVVKERSAALLVPFLALHSGLWFAETGEGGTARDSGSGGESAAVFPYNLTGFSAPAKLWETEFLAARAGAYGPEIIDRETAEGRLLWYGAGKGRVGFCRPEDTDLVAAFHENAGTDAEIFASGFFDRPRDFWEIKEALAKEKPGINSRECAEILWQAVWRGRLSADTFEPVRRGVEFGFVPKDVDGQSAAVSEAAKTPFMPGRHPRLPRALRDRWRTGAPAQGRWFSLDTGASLGDISGDPLDEECLNRDRVRLLLARYGLLCRPLLEHETPPFTWSGLLPAIRRMELAGELITGRFFSGINSPQFASPSVIRELERTEAFHGIYWMNAVDPASPAGRSVEGLPRFCDRVPGSRLYFKGTEIIAVSNRNGKELRIFTDPGDSDTVLLVSLFAVPRTRKVLPESKIVVEKINGKNAARGEYRAVFENAGFVFDREKLCLW